MTIYDFNLKWEKYLSPGHYGMDIEDPLAIKYLDDKFELEIKKNPSFNYSQIKLKFGMCRVYANTPDFKIWQDEIDRLLNNTHPTLWPT